MADDVPPLEDLSSVLQGSRKLKAGAHNVRGTSFLEVTSSEDIVKEMVVQNMLVGEKLMHEKEQVCICLKYACRSVHGSDFVAKFAPIMIGLISG